MTGKIFFITGGNRGIGYQLVSQISADSTNTVLAAIRGASSPSSQLSELISNRTNVKLVQLELTSNEDIESLPAQITKILGEDAVIDVFLSNAGVGEDMNRTLDTTDPSKWLTHYQINTLAPILTFQKLYPFLKKSQFKHTVFTTSAMGSIGGYIPVSSAAYGQTKAALNYSMKALSEELKEEGFILVSIHPGVVETDLLKESGLDMTNIPMLTEEQSAAKQVEFLNILDSSFNGKFYDAACGAFLTF